MSLLKSLLSIALISSIAQAAPSAAITETPPIVPLPAQLSLQQDKPGYLLEKGITLAPSEISPVVKQLFDGHDIPLTAGEQSDITFKTDAQLPREAYRLDVTPDSITVTSSSPAGKYYALATLAQSVVKDADGKPSLPSMRIDDKPRFGWRGIMIDSARHMLPVRDVKKIIDLMANYKFNTLHWHLTDDQGWRIEIKEYPKLTEIGSIRPESPITGNRKQKDGKPYKAYYTQEQIKEVVAYARERHITVVPEIEIPGHASAAIASYPELGNKDIKDYKPVVSTDWGVMPYIFSPSEQTFRFLDDVFSEVVSLFPDSPFIHIGGDEAPKTQWKQSAFAQSVMKENNLKNEEELQSYFVRRVEQIVNKHGKKIIGWDEIQEGGLSPTATMMVWRAWNNWKWAEFAISKGNDVIMVENSHLYFDYGQDKKKPFKPEYEPWGAEITWQKVYSYNPIPKGIAPELEKHVLGTQANLWSEHIPNLPKWEYQAFPRALALAEVAWTPASRKDEANFKDRMDRQLPYLDSQEVNYRNPDTGLPARPASVIQREPLQ